MGAEIAPIRDEKGLEGNRQVIRRGGPGVDPAIKQVRQQANDDKEKEDADQYRSHDDGEIQRAEGVDGYFPNTFQARNIFFEQKRRQQAVSANQPVMAVITGLSALRKPCFQMTTRGDSPLA